jgi:bifunctional non-homologous end joining protein LigD
VSTEPVPITHPEKVIFPDSGITKGELCNYYLSVAPSLLPQLRDRPVTMERFPAGIGRKGFIQKDITGKAPAWLPRMTSARRADGSTLAYLLVDDIRALMWMANQNTVTPHVWSARASRPDCPDLCLFDLDPPEGGDLRLGTAALAVRDLLRELQLTSFVKTSGSKGFHVVVALDGSADFGETWRFAQGVGRVLVKRHPQLFTQEFFKADREGRIFMDTGRNVQGATFAAPYAVRPRVGAPVSAPCTWAEIERQSVHPQSFTLRNLGQRLAQVGDLWRELPMVGTSLHESFVRLRSLLTEEDWAEAAAASKRRPRSRHRRAAPPSEGK